MCEILLGHSYLGRDTGFISCFEIKRKYEVRGRRNWMNGSLSTPSVKVWLSVALQVRAGLFSKSQSNTLYFAPSVPVSEGQRLGIRT